jgi:hypothetical protein
MKPNKQWIRFAVQVAGLLQRVLISATVHWICECVWLRNEQGAFIEWF